MTVSKFLNFALTDENLLEAGFVFLMNPSTHFSSMSIIKAYLIFFIFYD